MLFLKKLNVLLSKVWFSEIIAVGQIKICIESLKWVEHDLRRAIFSGSLSKPWGFFWGGRGRGGGTGGRGSSSQPQLDRMHICVSELELGSDSPPFTPPSPRPEAWWVPSLHHDFCKTDLNTYNLVICIYNLKQTNKKSLWPQHLASHN